MKLDKAITDARSAETDLAGELRKIGERHAVEQGGELALRALFQSTTTDLRDHLGL